uniref:Uncharacterized protein n=1 Tax=viral metagenome TaxID=1070528 RepID=A0A6C0F8P6_9ZZZZ|tara:strand:+ start:2788 stop:3012 length:225 start_codon:yes stop_codon:yes gene_type:complete
MANYHSKGGYYSFKKRCTPESISKNKQVKWKKSSTHLIPKTGKPGRYPPHIGPKRVSRAEFYKHLQNKLAKLNK